MYLFWYCKKWELRNPVSCCKEPAYPLPRPHYSPAHHHYRLGGSDYPPYPTTYHDWWAPSDPRTHLAPPLGPQVWKWCYHFCKRLPYHTGQEQACTRITWLSFGWLSLCRKWRNSQGNSFWLSHSDHIQGETLFQATLNQSFSWLDKCRRFWSSQSFA